MLSTNFREKLFIFALWANVYIHEKYKKKYLANRTHHQWSTVNNSTAHKSFMAKKVRKQFYTRVYRWFCSVVCKWNLARKVFFFSFCPCRERLNEWEREKKRERDGLKCDAVRSVGVRMVHVSSVGLHSVSSFRAASASASENAAP